MSFAIDNEVKDRVRIAVNIVDLLSSYMELRRQGRGFVGTCPFHDDRRPSLQVNPDRQTWKCWVCDVGGDVFSFVMKRENVTFPEALRMLADRAGIVIEESKSQSKFRSDKKKLYETMEWAVKEFHQYLLTSPDAKAAREYIESRGLTEESIKKFSIGFTPESWSWLVDRGASKSFTPQLIESVGLGARGERGTIYDRFRNRVIFPIRDVQSRPIAVGGRILPGVNTEAAKYVNCNETALYHKSHQLYNLDLARDAIVKSKQAVVMEGYTDVIMAVQHGIHNAVACCGTALGETQLKVLRRYCDSVVLLLDGDEAGQKRSREILELFVAEQMDLRILTLPEDLDPCDYLVKYGGDELRKQISGAMDALEFKVQHLCQGFDPLIDTHRANSALEDILGTMSKVSRETLVSHDSARLRHDQFIARLSRQFGIEQMELRNRIESIRQESSERARQRQRFQAAQNAASTNSPAAPALGEMVSEHPVAPQPIVVRYSELTAIEIELFELMALYEHIVPIAIERFPVSNLNSNTAKKIFQTYLDLELNGNALNFGSVLSAVEDAGVKSVLVSIEEHASRRAEKCAMTPDERLHSLCDRLSGHEDRAYRRQQISILERKQIDEQSELDLLNQIVSQARAKHGLTQTDTPQ
ncbi:DNA primase [Pirellulaceae bacterium SH449]